MTRLPWLTCLLLSTTAFAQTYDFENLTGSDIAPFVLLDGQDNWSEQTFNAARRCGVTATLSHDGTKSIQFQEVGPGYGCDASRINDAAWSFGPFLGTETRAFFQVDMRAGFWGGIFGPAHDTNQSGSVRGSEAGERGVRVSLGTNANQQLRLIAADNTVTTAPLASLGSVVNGSTWLRIRVVMDLTANAGAGLGYVFTQNLTAGETWFTAVGALQGIPLALDPTAADAKNPTRWDAMFLHFEGATYAMDNIRFGPRSAFLGAYEAGCGVPPLALTGRALPVVGTNADVLVTNLPTGALGGVLILGLAGIDPGLDLSAAGLTGCRLAVAPAASGDLTLGSSTASFALSIPASPALVGAGVFLQSAVVAPGVNPASVLTSNGLRWDIGLH
ncbi:MAG: hypothetical protein AB7I19_10960 [Planctomycetota bacterium]